MKGLNFSNLIYIDMESDAHPPKIEAEEETISLGQTLEVIKRNTKDIHDSMKQALESYHRVMSSSKEELLAFHEKKYRVHGLLKVWSLQHGFDKHLSIKEFLQVLFEEWGKQQRLDISKRSVQLNDEVAKLVHRQADEWIDLGTFFILIVALFESMDHKN